MEEKKSINWTAYADLADRFDELARMRFGSKGKWIVASAAMAMYLDASENQRKKYEAMILDAQMPGGVQRLLLEIDGEQTSKSSTKRKAAKKPPKSKGVRPKSDDDA